MTDFSRSNFFHHNILSHWVLGVLLTFVGILLPIQDSWGQNSKVLPFEHDKFLPALLGQVNRVGNKEVEDFLKGLEMHWQDGTYTESDKDQFVNHVNVMLLKNFSPDPEVMEYVKCVEAIKDLKSFGKIDLGEFFKVTTDAIQDLPRADVIRFYKFLTDFVKTGAAFRTSNATWIFSQPDPKLAYKSFQSAELNKTFYVPYLSFSNTDLKYKNPNDSTTIYGTSGDINILNRMFNASGGKIDWQKMKLDPNDVYVELPKYGINLNYAFIKVDSVKFHYKSLIDKVLIGQFEDINKGYRDINKANYPYFRSYEGGVVIENLIPNVRYEGGFSLKGIKKVGSAYTQWVDIPEVKEKPVKPKTKSAAELAAEKEAEELAAQLGYQYDESAFFIDDGTEFVEDTWSDDEMETDATESSDGGDLEGLADVDMSMLNKELKVFKAQLTVFRNQKPAMTLRALEFVLDLKKLVSKRTEVSLYLTATDSIYHPSVEVIYDVEKKEIALMKNVKDKFARQAFLSPYHNYYLYFDAIKWKTDTDQIEFTSVIDQENQISAIESRDMFNHSRWRQFKGVLSFHPIGAIYRYASLHPDEPITAEAVVAENGKKEEVEALKLHLADVEGSGFIIWNRETGIITPLPKLFDWSRAARGRDDYDAIQIISQVKSGDNAHLNLQTMEIEMLGIPFFSLSDSQFVRVKPNQRHTTVQKDRNLQFDGMIAAGKLNFYGRMSPDTAQLSKEPGKFRFQYENFKILCDSIDSLRFVLVRNPELGQTLSKLQKTLQATTIEGLTGAIYINKPNNKSGLEILPEYPVFDSYTQSYIYWYNPHVRGGVYTKDKLHFAIDPFVLDSLETFNEAALFFEGELYTSEIYPRMRQKLVMMPDFTLGLVQPTPPDTGYPAYAGKGRFKGDIKLDGNGLYSDGAMEFLGTVADADSFEMYFDSVRAVTNAFSMPAGQREGAFYPELKANAINYKWLTKKDEIELTTLEKGEPIAMFGGEGYFEGKLIITKTGLKGDGKLTLGDVVIESKEIMFREKDFDTKRGTFSVMDKNNPGKTIFQSKDVVIQYDVNTHHSVFTSDQMGKPTSTFPDQKFISSLAKGTFDKTQNQIMLESLSPKAGENYFVSVDPLQDSLRFNATSAVYNLSEKRLNIEGVKEIRVADAVVTPNEAKVAVKSDGFLDKLEDAVVVANETNKHRIYDANVEITSRKYYTGLGKYDYIKVNDQEQFITMADIKVRDSVTTATGVIKDDQKFFLTERIIFKGNAELVANQQFMNFKGQVKIDSKNPFFADKWFGYEVDNVNPDSVFIPIQQNTLGKLLVGLHYIKRNRMFYSTFLSPKKNTDDIDVALSTGGLTFDRDANSFRIGPEDKLKGRDYRGNTSTFNDETGVITTSGLLKLPYNFTKGTIEMGLAGTWRDDASSREVVTDLVGVFKLEAISKDAWTKLADRAKVVLPLNNDIDWTKYSLREGMAEFLDPNGGKPVNTLEFIAETEKSMAYTDIKVAKKLPYSLVLTDMPLRYDMDYKSLYGGGEIGIVGINSVPINKLSSSNSKIEYNIGKYTAAGMMLTDTLRIYLEFDEMNWVYFEFRGEVLYTASSDLDGYNAVLRSEIEKRKKNEGYRVELLDESAKDNFMTRYQERYIFKTGRPSPNTTDDEPSLPPPGDNTAPPPGDNTVPPPGDNTAPPPGSDEGGPLDDGLDDDGK